MVNTDGTVYLEYEVRTTNNNVIISDTLYLYSSPGTAIVLSTTTQDQALPPGPIIPDGQGGVLATRTVSPSHSVLQFRYQAACDEWHCGNAFELALQPNDSCVWYVANAGDGRQRNGRQLKSKSSRANREALLHFEVGWISRQQSSRSPVEGELFS
jgi:hypothetical protein